MEQQVSYANGWSRINNVFVYNHDWQLPAKTELWAYEKLIKKNNADLFTQYICFPWASLIDYLDHNPKKAKTLLNALKGHPPKMALKVVTYCQHIYALKMLPYFKLLGITDIFWSHKTIEQDFIDNIKLHPYSLYPVMHYKRAKPYKNKPLNERKYLYSFIGAYQPKLYLTKVRQWIFDLPKRDNTLIIERDEWHFEADVYREQLLGLTDEQAKIELKRLQEKEYIEVMEETVFCLCPSGSGPNSIRLWEAIKFGCIPIILSNTLDLKLISETNNKFIQANENIDQLDILLHDLSIQKIVN